MSTTPRRALGHWLEPLAASLWIFFLVWTLLVALVWALGLGEAEVLSWTQRQFHLPPLETGSPPAPLQAALVSFLTWVDPLWIVLAAANAYAFTSQREGLDVARRWAGAILLAVLLVAWLSASTTWPLGPIHFTEVLGNRLGPVPFCVPLLWLAVVLGARDLVLRLRPGCSQAALAVAAGLLVLLFDLALEPLAWKFRVFWLWYLGRLPSPTWPPMQSYATWLLLSSGLVYVLREKQLAGIPLPARRSPAAIYLLLLGVLVLTHLARLRH